VRAAEPPLAVKCGLRFANVQNVLDRNLKDMAPGRRYATPLAIVAGALLLCWPAFYNGYPLLYGDSASYLETLDPRKAHWARPVFYTVFLFPFHWRVWLWPAIFAQALIAAHLIYLVLRTTCGAGRPEAYLATIGVLAACSSLPWFASMIMPDVFTGVVVLGLYLLGVAAERLGRLERWYVAALTAGAIAFHLSHLAVAAGLVLVIVALRASQRDRAQFRPAALAFLLAPVVLAVVAHLGANGFARHGFSLSPASPVFMLARMIGDGTAQPYLREHCPQRGYVLCDYLEELPDDADLFLWESDGVFQRAGGPALREEAREIVAGVLATYPAWQLQRVGSNAVRQFFVFQDGDWLGIDDPAAHVIGRYIRHFFPADYPSYIASRQAAGRLPKMAITLWHAFFVVVGLTASAFLFLEFARRGERQMTALFVIMVAALIGNALITGGISGVHGRYQSRIVWLVVLYAALGAHYLYLCCSRETLRRDA
jgi:hypothetical protein